MSTTIRVRNQHIDSYGHVNNAQYLSYLEDARSDFFEELGYSITELSSRGIQVFITHLNLKYKHPAKLDDRLKIYGWFIEITSRKATWQHEIYNKQSGNLVLTGTVSGVFLKNGRIVSIPDDIREMMMRLYIPEQ